MASVELEHIRKIYPGGFEAIPDLSLIIPDGSFIVLLGPSGCGKSTLLRMIAGLETISAGTAKIGGRVVNEVGPSERDIAMVFQNYALYPHMSLYDNMAYGLRNRKRPEAEIAAKVNEAAQILSISHLLARKPRELSGGQRQRVAMGRAIVRDPQVFLFDEPLSNLDAKLRVQMRLEIRRLHNRLKATSVFVTHDQVEAMTLADQVVVMNAGRIEQVGTPLDIYHRPATRFVADFIGAPPMNVLKGAISGIGTVVTTQGRTLRYDPLRFEGAQGSVVDVGIRPENIRIVELSEPLPPDAATMIVDMVEELGPSRILYGTIDGESFAVVAKPGIGIQNGRVAIEIDPADVHLYNAVTGARLGKN